MARPREDYPVEELRDYLIQERDRQGLRDSEFATLIGIDRHALWRILYAARRCGRSLRRSILLRLGAPPDVWGRFLPDEAAPFTEPGVGLTDPLLSSLPSVQRAQYLVSLGLHDEACRNFENYYLSSVVSGDVLRQAEAAQALAWFNGELENDEDSLRWAAASVRLVEGYLSMSVENILASISPSQPPSGPFKDALYVLNMALSIQAKVLAVRILHYMEIERRPKADHVFDQLIRLDMRLLRPRTTHDFRWKAVMLASRMAGEQTEIRRALSESGAHASAATAASAALFRDRGVILWQRGKVEAAESFLWQAKDMLASVADGRALGPTHHVLSRISLLETERSTPDFGEALRMAITAAAFHPFGYISAHLTGLVSGVDDRRLLRELDELRAGRGPYQIVQRVMTVLANDSSVTVASMVERNLQRALGSRYGHLIESAEIPSPVRPEISPD